MSNNYIKLLKNKVYTFRIDWFLERRLKQISEKKQLHPSQFIRHAIKKMIDEELPIIEKKPVGRPKKNTPPTAKQIKTQKEFDKFIQQFNRYREQQALAVGNRIIALYEADKLNGLLSREVEELLKKI